MTSSVQYGPTAARALSYLSERAEDAQATIKGILGGQGPGAAGPSGADRYLGGVDVTSGEQGVMGARLKLESSLEQDRLDGLRTVVAMISKSLPAANHLFPSVLKLTSAQSLQVKTLVYLVTLRLAPSQPDVALLSINSFQRDLSDSSPLIRGMSLRVLSGLGVKMALPLMEMAIAKSIRDPSFYVRKIAADAIGKCCELSSSTLPSLLPHLSALLADRHPSVLGSTLLAFNCTVPTRYELLHPHFRRICHALVDIDEWNLPITMRILTGYARTYLPRPNGESACIVAAASSEKAIPGRTRWGTGLDKDLELLLAKAEPLLSTRNPAVTLAVAHLYVSLLPMSSPVHQRIIPHVLRLLRCHPSQASIALSFLRRLQAVRPDLLRSHSHAFLPLSSISGDPYYVTNQKLDMLVDLAATSSSQATTNFALSEMEEALLHRSEQKIVCHAAKALGRLAAHSQESTRLAVAERCTEALMSAIKERSGSRSGDEIVATAMSVLRGLVHARAPAMPAPVHDPEDASAGPEHDHGTAYILYRLSTLLFKKQDKAAATATATTAAASSSASVLGKSSITDGEGRASICWLLGQYCSMSLKLHGTGPDGASASTHKTLAETILPDVLRRAALNFPNESRPAKLALLALSSKLLAFIPSTKAPAPTLLAIEKLHAYILQLARFDLDHDIRDRSRYYKTLTARLGFTHGEGSEGMATPPGEASLTASNGSLTGLTSDSTTDGVAGVRLRREQVMLVLFNQKTIPSATAPSAFGPNVIAENDPAVLLDPLTLTVEPKSGKSGKKTADFVAALPDWASETAQLPPSSIRDVSDDTASLAALGSSLQPQQVISVRAAGAGIRSLSSDQFASGSGGGGLSSSSSPSLRSTSPLPGRPVVLTPTQSQGKTATVNFKQGKGKYQDLDAFLNESESESESEESTDSSDGKEEQEQDDGDDDDDDDDASEADSTEEESSEDEDSDDDDDDEAGDLLAAPLASKPLLAESGNAWAT